MAQVSATPSLPLVLPAAAIAARCCHTGALLRRLCRRRRRRLLPQALASRRKPRCTHAHHTSPLLPSLARSLSEPLPAVLMQRQPAFPTSPAPAPRPRQMQSLPQMLQRQRGSARMASPPLQQSEPALIHSPGPAAQAACLHGSWATASAMQSRHSAASSLLALPAMLWCCQRLAAPQLADRTPPLFDTTALSPLIPPCDIHTLTNYRQPCKSSAECSWLQQSSHPCAKAGPRWQHLRRRTDGIPHRPWQVGDGGSGLFSH